MTNSTSSQRAALAGWLVCSLGAIFYCYEYLLRIEPSVMGSELMAYFSISYEGFGFLTGFYYFAYTPMQLVVGLLTDIFGPRRILTIAVGFCALGSYLFALPQGYFTPATLFYIACFGRFLIGFGSAFAFVGVLKLAVIWLPANRFAIFSGLATALGMLGAMVGDTELTRLIATIGWRDTIYISAAFGVLLIPLLWFTIDDAHDRKSEDIEGASYAKQVFKGLPDIIKTPQIWIAGFIACFFYLSLAGFAEAWGVEFIRHTYHLSRDVAANCNAAIFAGWLVGGPIAGLASDAFKTRRTPLIVGAAITFFLVTGIIYFPVMNYIELWIALFIYGIFSSVEIICFSLGRENAANYVSGTAISFINMLTMLSGMVFQPFIGTLMEWFEHGILQQIVTVTGYSHYQLAFVVMPLGCLGILILSLFLRETNAQPVVEDRDFSASELAVTSE